MSGADSEGQTIRALPCAGVGEHKINETRLQWSVADWHSLKLRQPLANIRILGEVKPLSVSWADV
jgi:hypothetical protein